MASETGPSSVEELVKAVRAGRLTRRQFIVGLTGLGVSGVAAVTILKSVNQPHTTPSHPHIKQHDQHITRQMQGDVHGMMADYDEHAVVDDPLFSESFVGLAAIASRYAAEVSSAPDRALQIIKRTVVGAQLVIEWEATGTHSGDFLGFGGTGRPYTLRGATVVTRQNGKIVRESHYYDVASFRRQVEGVIS
jgi:steroid delta-isomerase-like uncharacterized protein